MDGSGPKASFGAEILGGKRTLLTKSLNLKKITMRKITPKPIESMIPTFLDTSVALWRVIHY